MIQRQIQSYFWNWRKKPNFSAKKLSAAEVEEFGIGLSIDEGLKSGLLTENEKQDFMKFLKQV